MQEITVKQKNVYGKILIYPVCEKAVVFSNLIGTKTLTMNHLNLIEQLGYTVNLIKLP